MSGVIIIFLESTFLSVIVELLLSSETTVISPDTLGSVELIFVNTDNNLEVDLPLELSSLAGVTVGTDSSGLDFKLPELKDEETGLKIVTIVGTGLISAEVYSTVLPETELEDSGTLFTPEIL